MGKGRRGCLTERQDRNRIIDQINEAKRVGARFAPACNLLGISIRTLERWQKPCHYEDRRKKAKRRVVNKLTLDERQQVIAIANESRFKDLPPCKIVPLLAEEGEYIASESTFYRILKSENQSAHRGKSCAPKRNRPKECVAYKPGQVWSWDITYLPTQILGRYFYLYMIMDIFSRKIVGFRVHTEESGAHASNLIEQTCLDENISSEQLILHQDNGSPMKSAIFNATLKRLGVIPSFSRPAVSDDNPYSESLFKTLKYRPEFPVEKCFATAEAANKWCEWFVDWYNKQHLHSELKFLTPEHRHTGKDCKILEKRHATYLFAKQKNPLRWSGRKTRNWNLPDKVMLNPNKKNKFLVDNKKSMCKIAV